MSDVLIVAEYALSPFGAGEEAYGLGGPGDRPRVVVADDPRGRADGLLRPRSARVAETLVGEGDRPTRLLLGALRGCAAELDATWPGWRARRLGLVVGTSSGAMESAQSFFAAWDNQRPIGRAQARAATYFAPVEQAVRELALQCVTTVQVLGACASSTIALGLGMRWLQLGRCDLVIAAGYDALSSFVAAGFESLGATTRAMPLPFRLGRDGMALGEGAIAVGLALGSPEQERTAVARVKAGGALASRALRVRARLLGFGMSSDAVHLTAPDRSGRGLARAAQAALGDAGVSADRIALVSAHATATPFNDAAEARALALALQGAHGYTVHPLKAQLGHTLGAAGLLETMAIAQAMHRGIAPAAAGDAAIDPECAVPLLEHNARRPGTVALKLSSAFGGVNAALVVGAPDAVVPRAPSKRPAKRSVYLRRHTMVRAFDAHTMAELLSERHAHPHRPDVHAQWVIAAVSALGCGIGMRRDPRAGLVLGHTLATLEQNHAFEQRRRTRGPRFVEARRFPATSPNAAAGEAAIAFGLEGPSFAVGASLHGAMEALAVARDLIAAGDADSMVVVGVHLQGVVSKALLELAEMFPIEVGACAAYLHAEPIAGSVALEPFAPPHTQDGEAARIGSGVGGPAELAAYLAAQQKPLL